MIGYKVHVADIFDSKWKKLDDDGENKRLLLSKHNFLDSDLSEILTINNSNKAEMLFTLATKKEYFIENALLGLEII